MKINLLIILFLSLISLNVYSSCTGTFDHKEPLLFIENDYEDVSYSLSIDVDCEGKVLSLEKRVYDKYNLSFLENEMFSLELNHEKIMIQKLQMKTIVKFKILELDPYKKGLVLVSYANRIFKNEFKTFSVSIKRFNGAWRAYSSKENIINYLNFSIKKNIFGIPTKVKLTNQDLIDFPELNLD